MDNEERYEQFSTILKPRKIKCTHKKDPIQSIQHLKKEETKPDCIYIEEPESKELSNKWESTYHDLINEAQCPLIICTKSEDKRSTSFIKYIKSPFGFGLFMEAISVGFQRGKELYDAQIHSNFSAIEIILKAKTKILAIDEKGGVLELKFPIIPGGEIILDHEIIEKAWEENEQVIIKNVTPPPDGTPNIWQVRFDRSLPGTSISKYWEKTESALKQILNERGEKEE